MIRNLIVLFAFASFVKASVIINVLDDSEASSKTKATYSLDGCNYQACDQLCRRLGFTGGACVGDTCKCDNFEPVHINRKSLMHLLREEASTKATYSLNGCNFQACDQICRNLGFPGGACVGDKCDCDNFKKDSGTFAETTKEKIRVAVNKQKLISSKGAVLKAVTRLEDSCFHFVCNLTCQSLGYIGGTCISDSCLCY